MKNKLICLHFSVFIFLCFSGSNLFAQQIELPSVTTVIEDSTVVKKATEVPDFNKKIDENIVQENEVVLLDLPIPQEAEKEEIVVFQKEPSLYSAKGSIGGGYPTTFVGDFSFTTINDLVLDFKHYGISGYANKKLSDGFYTKDTSIYLKKQFNFNNFDLDFSVKYEDLINGLQGQVENIASVNQDSICATTGLKWNLPENICLGVNAFTDLYYRFADITKKSDDSFVCNEWIKKSTFFWISPQVFVKWSGNGFDVAFNSNYFHHNNVNRGDFKLSVGWKNQIWDLYSDVALVVGNNLNGNKVIVPFTVKADVNIPLNLSDKKLNFGINSGLKSYQSTAYDLEKQYRFSGVNVSLKESSDWFTKLYLNIPLKSAFMINASAEYNITAFNNGRWLPSYTDEFFVNGLYCYNNSFTETLETIMTLTYKYKIFTFGVKWNSNWIDLLPTKNKNMFFVNFAVDGEKWGMNINTGYSVFVEDKTPIIDVNIFANLTDSVTLELTSNDLLKLCSKEGRVYEGRYISQGGNVTMMIKFLF